VFLIRNDFAVLSHSLKDYFSFICLLAALFVASGGISIAGDLEARPKVNSLFLVIGAVLANFIGTTGASMVLIRPFLKTNSERRHVFHLPIFFIIVVSNCGGLLTPLGDPPLFLGYLKGVPFFWTLKLFPIWIIVIGALISVFYVWDTMAYGKENRDTLIKDKEQVRPLKIEGRRGIIFLIGIILSVFTASPIREGLMIVLTISSLMFGSKQAFRNNRFSWHPIQEVAIIFAGIFITMGPALALLEKSGPALGITKPWEFFWLTGILSTFLDNAPTYLTFFSLGEGLGFNGNVAGLNPILLKAISAGAVLMGANSYIGNGPNFMVKSIADHSGFKTPSFFGYMLIALAMLFPLYLLITFLFFI